MLVWIYRFFGAVMTAFGIIGMFLPLMPTTIFLILACWAFSRGSPEWHRWLLHHPRYGITLQNWENYRIVPRRGKVFMSLSMLVSVLILCWVYTDELWIPLHVAVILAAVAVYVWRKPETRAEALARRPQNMPRAADQTETR